MNEKNFNTIPANACLMSVGEFKLGDNGEGSKTAPISLTARSGKPIEHWFWGKVVHDLSGMRLHKSRLAIDYVHDDKEVIGYLNNFDSSSGDLVASGALVPFKDSDRATEILHKLREGVPYEASINFGGDGIKVEELPEGMVSRVNGYQLEGPAVIIREWPLRGVAVCPYGADANTESRALSNTNKTFSATVASATVPLTATPTEETAMSESVEVVAQGTETAQATEEQKTEEATETEAPAVEVPAVETVKKDEDQKPAELSREEFSLIADKFGNDIAVRCMREGKGYDTAFAWHAEALECENEELKKQLSEFTKSNGTTGKPVAMSAQVKKQTLLALCEKGTKGTK